MNPPSKPATPTKVDSLSNSTKITVRWEKNSVPSAELPGGRITHYRLFMDDGLFGDFQQVAYLSSSLSQMTLYDLVPGRSYRFKVVAGNFNQEGDYSDSGLHFACTLPSGLAAPLLTGLTTTTMSLGWKPPVETGGCPILGYYLMRGDGFTGAPSIEVNTVNDPAVRNLPTLRYADVQLLESDLGLSYTF